MIISLVFGEVIFTLVWLAVEGVKLLLAAKWKFVLLLVDLYPFFLFSFLLVFC